MNVYMAAAWCFVLIAAVIIELMTVQFVSIWFACAALVSLLLAGFGAPLWAQLSVFCAVSVLLLIVTRPIVRKIRGGYVRTNADLNIGKTAVITERVDNSLSKGRAKVGGVSWIAVSEDGSSIEEGEVVVIKDIDGAKLIVSRP